MKDNTNTDELLELAWNAGYEEGWTNAINNVLDISQQMRYNDLFKGPTLEELEQRIV
jgi:hypothetical protein